VQNFKVPVLLIGYNRPEFLLKRVQELLLNNVEILHISVDGNESLFLEMQSTLNIIEKICKGNCLISTNLHLENLGLAKHITSEITKMLDVYPEVLIIEDDIEIGRNFIENMSNGLKVLRAGTTFGVVSGFSPLSKTKFLPFKNKWRFSPYFNCWGWICTREAWSNYILDISNLRINTELESSETWNQLNKWQQYLWLSRFIKIQRTPFHTWDIQFQYMCFKHNMVNISPIFSLSNNTGFNDSRSIHTKGRKPKWMSDNYSNSKKTELKASKLTSILFSKIVEPLTTSGDSRFIRLRHKIRG